MPRLVLPAACTSRTPACATTQARTRAPSTCSKPAASVTLLHGARAPFDLVFSQHGLQFDEAATFPSPMIYQDPQRSFFIKPSWQTVLMGYNTALAAAAVRVPPLPPPVHGAVPARAEAIRARGPAQPPDPGHPAARTTRATISGSAATRRAATVAVHASAQTDIVDFELGGAYSIYNWEIFFHAPLMVAVQAHPEPALRGGDALVPLHLRPHQHRGAPLPAALLGHPARSSSRTATTTASSGSRTCSRTSGPTSTSSGPGRTTPSSRT